MTHRNNTLLYPPRPTACITTSTIEQVRSRHRSVLATMRTAIRSTERRNLLTAAYYCWHLNHHAKLPHSTERSQHYALKDRCLKMMWQASQVHPLAAIRSIGGRLMFPVVPLHPTDPAGAITLARVYAGSAYLSFRLTCTTFTFSFHAPWRNVTSWLCRSLQDYLITFTHEQQHAHFRPFTFGGRAATRLEVQAIPISEIVTWLTRWCNQQEDVHHSGRHLTGR